MSSRKCRLGGATVCRKGAAFLDKRNDRAGVEYVSARSSQGPEDLTGYMRGCRFYHRVEWTMTAVDAATG